MEYYSAIKKNEIMPLAATWMDLEIIILSEISQRQISYDIAYMLNLKKWYKWTYLQNRNRLTDLENELMVTRGKGGGVVWNWHVHTAVFKIDNQQGPTV